VKNVASRQDDPPRLPENTEQRVISNAAPFFFLAAAVRSVRDAEWDLFFCGTTLSLRSLELQDRRMKMESLSIVAKATAWTKRKSESFSR
jgi:hypothetical protein